MKRTFFTIFILFILSSCQIINNKSDDYFSTNKMIVANYNNGKITLEDAQKELDQIAEKNKDLKNIKFEDLSSDQKEQIIKQIVLKIKSYKEAKKTGLHKDQDYIDAVRNFKIDLLQQKLIMKFNEKAKDEEILKAEYSKLAQNLQGKYDYNIRYILLGSKKSADIIYRKLKKSPKLFAREAKRKSLDKEVGKNGGSLGFVLEDALPQEIITQIRKIKKNQISKPFTIQDKWIIVRYEDKRKAKIVNFEDAKESLSRGLTMRYLQDFKIRVIEEANINMAIK